MLQEGTIFEKRKSNTQLRYEKIRKRIDYLYNQERLRWDDALTKVAEEFTMSERTIQNILKKPMESIKASNQISMF